MAEQYLNFTCIIPNEAIAKKPGVQLWLYNYIRHEMKQLPRQAKCSGDSFLPCDIKHTHTSPYRLKQQQPWLCSPLPVLLKSSI